MARQSYSQNSQRLSLSPLHAESQNTFLSYAQPSQLSISKFSSLFPELSCDLRCQLHPNPNACCRGRYQWTKYIGTWTVNDQQVSISYISRFHRRRKATTHLLSQHILKQGNLPSFLHKGSISQAFKLSISLARGQNRTSPAAASASPQRLNFRKSATIHIPRHRHLCDTRASPDSS